MPRDMSYVKARSRRQGKKTSAQTRYETLSRKKLVQLASGGKLKVYRVDGKSKSIDIVDALYERDENTTDSKGAKKAKAKQQKKEKINHTNRQRSFLEDLVAAVERGDQVDLTKHNSDAMSPLMAACQIGLLNAVNVFIQHGADVNENNFVDMTPILIASKYGFLDIVNALLKHGADPALTNVLNKNAADLAGDNDHEDIVDLLKSKGVVPAKNPRGTHEYRYTLTLKF
jgi:ankyrin repeat protein